MLNASPNTEVLRHNSHQLLFAKHLQVFALFVKAPPKKFDQQEQQLRTVQQSFR